MKKLCLLLAFLALGFLTPPPAHALSLERIMNGDPWMCEAYGGMWLSGLGGEFCLCPWEMD